MRCAALLLIAACGRLGFDARPGSADGGDSSLGDGATIAWSQLVAYADQTCAALGNNAYCWGANGSGQLGNGTMTNAPMPVRVQLPTGTLGGIAQDCPRPPPS